MSLSQSTLWYLYRPSACTNAVILPGGSESVNPSGTLAYRPGQVYILGRPSYYGVVNLSQSQIHTLSPTKTDHPIVNVQRL